MWPANGSLWLSSSTLTTFYRASTFSTRTRLHSLHKKRQLCNKKKDIPNINSVLTACVNGYTFKTWITTMLGLGGGLGGLKGSLSLRSSNRRLVNSSGSGNVVFLSGNHLPRPTSSYPPLQPTPSNPPIPSTHPIQPTHSLSFPPYFLALQPVHFKQGRCIVRMWSTKSMHMQWYLC